MEGSSYLTQLPTSLAYTLLVGVSANNSNRGDISNNFSSPHSSDNNNSINMTYKDGSNLGNFYIHDSNRSGNSTAPEPFDLPTYTLVWVVVANILVFIAGVLGNVLVIVVVLCVREMKTATNLCLMNLSIADLLVQLICQPSALLEFFAQERWLIGEAMCKLVSFLENLVTLASILIILTVSMERFWAVYYPLKTYSQGSKKKAMITMIIVWITAIIITVPFLVMSHTVRVDHSVVKGKVDICVTPMNLVWHKIYIVGRFILVFTVPLLTLAVLYSLIIVKVMQETMECKQMTETARSQSQQNRRQLVIMLVGIIILFFVCLLPFQIIALILIFSPSDYLIQVMGPETFINLIYFCRLLIYVNSAGNPIIYNIVSTKFRRAFHRVLHQHCCCCKKYLAPRRSTINGNHSHATRMTTMSHYSVVKQDTRDLSDTGDAV